MSIIKASNPEEGRGGGGPMNPTLPSDLIVSPHAEDMKFSNCFVTNIESDLSVSTLQ